MTDTVDDTTDLRAIVEDLTLEEKVSLVQGVDFWTTAPIPRIGLRAMTLSDGPSGVRGPVWDERSPSLNLPSASALAATWDPSMAWRYGAVTAAEARRKDVDVVLGPTINLHRSPLGGRHFECLSEDPELTASIGASYIRGVQDNGVAATPKHYVANDSETDRFTVDVKVGERALRELYMVPFERAVEAGTWGIMSAYNSVDGVTMTENQLLENPLTTEWGFDGVVVSDWTAVRSLKAASAAQDLAMPGPAPAWAGLAEAVRSGEVPESALDRKVERLLRLAARVGALGDTGSAELVAVEGRPFIREAAIEGTVLLSNDGTLPLAPQDTTRLAVVGHNAKDARTQGGGSATVLPEAVVSPLAGLQEALPGSRIDYALGAVVQEGVAGFPLDQITNPVTGEAGVHVRFVDGDGEALFAEDRLSTALVWFGGEAPVEAAAGLELSTVYRPDETGEIQLGFAGAAPGRVYVDGQLLLDETPVFNGTDLGAAFLNPPSSTARLQVKKGRDIELRAEFTTGGPNGGPSGALSVTFGIAPPEHDPDELIAQAAAAAAAAEVAVVVVGTNSVVESEGYDRTDLRLPGRQDDLVRAVAAANRRTVVVVNAGSPVELPWKDEVSAVLMGYFGGQEFGAAIVDILTGAAEPGGRLPTTWPGSLQETPVSTVIPTNGVLEYTEGIHIGYRAWLRTGETPAFPFGHGLGYTSWSWDAADVSGDAVQVRVTNAGARPGKQVVQVYAERPESAVERPVRWLVGFAVVRAAAGESVTAQVQVPGSRFAHWEDGWRIEPGAFTLRIGGSVEDLPLRTVIDPQATDGDQQ